MTTAAAGSTNLASSKSKKNSRSISCSRVNGMSASSPSMMNERTEHHPKKLRQTDSEEAQSPPDGAPSPYPVWTCSPSELAHATPLHPYQTLTLARFVFLAEMADLSDTSSSDDERGAVEVPPPAVQDEGGDSGYYQEQQEEDEWYGNR